MLEKQNSGCNIEDPKCREKQDEHHLVRDLRQCRNSIDILLYVHVAVLPMPENKPFDFPFANEEIVIYAK
jgi:hypothetical protein